MAVGKEAIVANAMESARQHVEQEAAHELADIEAQDLPLVTTAFPIILPAESDMGRVEIEQPAVGDRDTMRIAREATRYDAMHMRMMLEVLTPGVQDGGDADVGPEMLGIGGDGGDRLGCRREQQPIDLGL